MCVCVCVKERERARERDRDRDRVSERERKREKERGAHERARERKRDTRLHSSSSAEVFARLDFCAPNRLYQKKQVGSVTTREGFTMVYNKTGGHWRMKSVF